MKLPCCSVMAIGSRWGLTPRPPFALPGRLSAHQIRWASLRWTHPPRLLSRGGTGADCQHLVSA